jgi:hypothetical protein
MPVGAYFKGHGNEVMANMVKQYGAKKGKSVFYATANKRKVNPLDYVDGKALGKHLRDGGMPGNPKVKQGRPIRLAPTPPRYSKGNGRPD